MENKTTTKKNKIVLFDENLIDTQTNIYTKKDFSF